MSLNRGRLIIGERPACDVIQCLRCRAKWEANDAVPQPEICVVCGVPWNEPIEWDRSSVMRRVWYIEWRWRDGFGFGPWHNADVVPGTATPEEIDELLARLKETEQARQVSAKGVLRFEYRAISTDVEIYQPPRRPDESADSECETSIAGSA